MKSTSPSVHPRTPLSSSGTPHVRSSPRPPVSEQCSIVIGETSGPWTGRDGNDYVMAQVVENGHSGSSSRYRGSPPMVKEEPREDYLHGSVRFQIVYFSQKECHIYVIHYEIIIK